MNYVRFAVWDGKVCILEYITRKILFLFVYQQK